MKREFLLTLHKLFPGVLLENISGSGRSGDFIARHHLEDRKLVDLTSKAD